MKNGFTIIMVVSFLITGVRLHAQDSSKTSAMQQIKNSSEKTDNLQGKEIQQQSLLSNRVEKLDTVVAMQPAKKKKVKSRHKH